jgi:uncharacterized protein
VHTNAEVGARLKRASGHLIRVIEMIEQGRPCMDLAQQLHAVEKVVGNAKKQIIKDHLHHCRDQTLWQLRQSDNAMLIAPAMASVGTYLRPR